MYNTKLLDQNKKSNNIFILLVLGLLILRFPYLIPLCLNKIPISYEIGLNIFDVGTYLITAMLIVLMRNSLSN